MGDANGLSGRLSPWLLQKGLVIIHKEKHPCQKIGRYDCRISLKRAQKGYSSIPLLFIVVSAPVFTGGTIVQDLQEVVEALCRRELSLFCMGCCFQGHEEMKSKKKIVKKKTSFILSKYDKPSECCLNSSME